MKKKLTLLEKNLFLIDIMTFVCYKENISFNIINLFLDNYKKYLLNGDIHLYKEIIFTKCFDSIQHQQIINIYIKSKNIKNKLKTLINLYKWKKAVVYDMTTDLYLNPLEKPY